MKKALILGASSGIGKEMTFWLARNGWRVAVTGRRGHLLDAVASADAGNILPFQLDVDDTDALPGHLEALTERLGGLDLFVVSAGTGYLNPRLDPELEQKTVATNVQAFTAAMTWAFNHFKKDGGGRIAAITSVGGLVGEANAPAYPASKAYQILYLNSLRKRAKKENPGCVITELRPGSVDTDMMKGEGHFWITPPAKAAEFACDAIMRGKKLQYISPRWSIIGFVLRFLTLFS